MATAGSIAWGQQAATAPSDGRASPHSNSPHSNSFQSNSLQSNSLQSNSLQSNKDVAITSIVQDGPPFAHEGDSVTIRIGASNNGDSEETFEVSLNDVTDNLQIGSKSVTVASGGSTTIAFDWDTTGATGGPPPPGPPAPGSIHQLTATATLDGDASTDNNSMSLLPGIWIIAAPSSPVISFPNMEQEPQAVFGKERELSLPAVDTTENLLTTIFLGPTDVTKVIPASRPNLGTRLVNLPGIFSTKALGNLSGELARPQVVATIAIAAQIIFDGIQASLEVGLIRPALDTVVKSPPGISLDRAGPAQAQSLERPSVATAQAQLGEIFASLSGGKLHSSLNDPRLQTRSGPREPIQTSILQASAAQSLSEAGVSTIAKSSKSLRSFSANADAGGALMKFEVATLAQPPSKVFPGGIQSDFSLPGGRPDVGAQPQLLRSPFVSKGAVVLNTERPLANPFESIVIRGTIKLQGRKSSLGSYVEVGDEVFFTDSNGSYEFMVQGDAGKIVLKAPGYVPVVITNSQLESGGSISLPTMTLLFGDANEDGVIDIYDITIAAGNFGETTRRLTNP